MAILLTGGAWVSLVTQSFALIHGPAKSRSSTRLELRRFSDFLQRESDLSTCTVIISMLVLLALLPLASFHSALMVRPASPPQPLTRLTAPTLDPPHHPNSWPLPPGPRLSPGPRPGP